MLNIQNQNGGYIIDNKVFLGDQEIEGDYICLKTTIGHEMNYKKRNGKIIDFPGEYDIESVGIKAFAGKDNKLNYVVHLNGKRLGIIQSDDILEQDDVSVVNCRLSSSDEIFAKIDQLELEGEKVKL